MQCGDVGGDEGERGGRGCCYVRTHTYQAFVSALQCSLQEVLASVRELEDKVVQNSKTSVVCDALAEFV